MRRTGLAAVLGHEVGHDDAVALCFDVFHVLGSLTNRVDGLVDSETEGMPCYPLHITHAGLDVERAIDGEWHDGQLQFVCQHESTTFENTHVTGEGAGPFWKDHQRHAITESGTCLVVGFLDFSRTTFIYKYLMRILASNTHKRYLSQLSFHHPLEIAT